MTRIPSARGGDLFAGFGGMSAGLQAASREAGLKLKLLAINHWRLATEVYAASFPAHQVMCADLGPKAERALAEGRLFSLMDVANPYRVGPPAPWRILVAGPECTHHSNARGGKPRSDQSRATVWCIPRWIEAKRPRSVVIENVPEFRDYGPLYLSGKRKGKPIPSRKGETFRAFLGALESLNYRVEHRILNCADYGDATTRRRLFIFAVRGRRKVPWPEPTHAPAAKAAELGLAPWRAAAEIIDWAVPGHSIFLTRAEAKAAGLRIKRPLSPNTLRRIAVGIGKYWGAWAEPFLVMLRGTSNVRGVDLPLPTVTAGGGHVGLVEPFLVTLNHTKSAEHDRRYTRRSDKPLPTITSQGNRFGLAEPFILATGQTGGNGRRVRSVAQPLGTLVTKPEHCLIQADLAPALVLNRDARGRTRKVEEPLPTITGRGSHGLAEGVIIGVGGPKGSQKARSVREPLRTVTGDNHAALVRPFLVKYNRTGKARPVEAPLDTISTKHRFALVEPGVVKDEKGRHYILDIRFRMLRNPELAAAHGLTAILEAAPPKVTQQDLTKMIGNSVPFHTAHALCREALR